MFKKHNPKPTLLCARFHLLYKIKSGAHGTVFKGKRPLTHPANDLKSKQPIALKMAKITPDSSLLHEIYIYKRLRRFAGFP